MRANKTSLSTWTLFLAILLSLSVINVAWAKPTTDGIETLRQKVTFGEAADIFLGKAGVFFTESAYTGNVELSRVDPKVKLTPKDLEFARRWVDVQVVDSKGDEFQQVFGLVYVYFNLDKPLLNAYKAGDLKIYFYDESEKSWTACPVQVEIKTKNQPNGRLACVISDFGLYGLAIER